MSASAPALDLLVVGGGPAGLATAMHAAAAGLAVTVLEARDGPVDKACGEGLMPGAVAALGALGVEVGGLPFLGIRYVDGAHTAEARFGSAPGAGVRRTALHAAMTERALALGVEVDRARVDDVRQGDGWVSAGGRRARYLVAADGLHSPVRAALGLGAARAGRARYGVRRHYAVEPWSDLVEVHWAARCEAYVTPVGPRLVGVAVLGGRGTRVDDALASLPTLRERLAGADQVGRDRGAGPLRQRTRARVAGRVLLVGDAAGYVDALTGEGVRLGLAEAGAAVERGAPRPARGLRAGLDGDHGALPPRHRAARPGHRRAAAAPRTGAGRRPAARRLHPVRPRPRRRGLREPRPRRRR